jgi:hypothetical protein
MATSEQFDITLNIEDNNKLLDHDHTIIEMNDSDEEEMKLSNISYRKRIEFIVNLSIGEYFISNSIADREYKMTKLFKKLTTKDSIIEELIGTSRWEKTDNIKLIPVKNKNLCKYIKENYCVVWTK